MVNQTTPSSESSKKALAKTASPLNKLSDRNTNNDSINDVSSYIKQEQSKIDEELKFLLNFEPKRKLRKPKNDAQPVNDKTIPTFIKANSIQVSYLTI